ncbi:MAG TPA: hypothetical protein DIT10_05945 [Chryseobacterium sp.]|nr:hypothetical protein [Chryseobacterium sp.]
MNSGTIDLNIPLFDLTEGKFEISNKLSYESRGFSPNIPVSYVGLNWNLQQFGKITRESRRADLTMSSSSYLNPINNGFPEGDPYSPKDYYSNDCIKVLFPPIGGNKSYKKNIYENPYEKDYYAGINFPDNPEGVYSGSSRNFEPDKYYFDFLGTNGYFLIDNEGNPIVYSENSSLKIDINNYGCHDIFGNITYSQIKITDDKGNQYFFGGTPDALDINYYYARVIIEDIEGSSPTAFEFYSTAAKTNSIDAWLLKKIILNNGEIVEAHYQNPSLDILNNFRGTLKDSFKREYYPSWGNPKYEVNTGIPSRQNLINNNLTVTNSRTITEVITNGGCTPSCGISKATQVDTYTKKAVLDSIKFNNLNISYEYDWSQNESDLTNKYLQGIAITRGKKLIKKINLIYEDLGATNKRTFLNRIINNSEETFDFEYYNTDDFPQLLLADYDINSLGYWKGHISPDSYGLSDDFTAYDTGLLKKITYPTKGNTTYFYEHGNYSKIFKFKAPLNPYDQPPGLFNENNTVNAPRIYKKIESDLVNSEETLYEYKKDDGSSSGIIDDAVYDNFGFYSNKNTVGNLNSINSLRYSNVKVKKQNNGYTKYSFSDRTTNPDILTSKVFFRPNYSTYCTKYQQWAESNRIYLSKQYERGKVLNEEIYNDNGIKLKETAYQYNNFLNKFPNLSLTENCTDCKVSDLNYYIRLREHNFNCQRQTIYVPVIPYKQTSQITKEYFDNKVIETTNKTGYLDKILKTYTEGTDTSKNFLWYPYPKENSFTSTSGTIIKKYIYPIDLYNENPCTTCNDDNTIVGGQYNTYRQLHYKNIFTPVIEITKNNDNKFSLKENIFSPVVNSTQGAYAIKTTRKSLLNAELDFANYKIPISNTEKNLTFDLYDNKLNPIQTTNKSGIASVTLWGYNQSLPIATIEGATYSQVMQAFGLNPADSNSYLQLDIVKKSDLDIDEATENAFITELDLFKNKNGLKDFRVSTYTHNPLIGPTSITSDSGIKEFYKYDTANRLEKVVDINNKTVKEYQYNYIPVTFYNKAVSKDFIKNNCGADYAGGKYTYTVPANTYSSKISQADADKKAQNDINANGQNTANANTTCIRFYNVLRSQVFTRNNCGFFGIGQDYTYTVPANSFFSIISQADADQKAQNDINANGQLAANANAGCLDKPFDCTISTDMNFYDNASSFFNKIYNVNNVNYAGTICFNTKTHNWTAIGKGSQKVGKINGMCRPKTFKYYRGGNWSVSIYNNGDIYATWEGVFSNPQPNSMITISFQFPYE